MAYTDIDKPSDYFNTKLYTGNGGTQSITGVGFQPNMTWIKGRSFADNHFITDSVRGVTKTIFPDLTAAEETQSGALTAFGSDGFSVGSMAEGNTNGATICSWNWLAGTSVSGTSTGSGTGKAYSGSVNTTSGFSIIKYLGNGSSGHTIPHHLSAVPQFIVVKSLDRGTNWITYQAPLGAGKFLRLNQTNAESTSSSRWNDTTPTSTVFTVGNDGDLNNNDEDYIAYIIANVQGYSKVGSYTGNGNADGPFVYTGFKPAYVMLKRTDTAGERWNIKDNKRDGYNQTDPVLTADASGAEYDDSQMDLLSNGFKIRTSAVSTNASGGTYIYMAFAENPFVTSTGVPATAR
jgi:hypothetical protein